MGVWFLTVKLFETYVGDKKLYKLRPFSDKFLPELKSYIIYV